MGGSQLFDQVWRDYAALRPGYPDALFDFVAATSSSGKKVNAIEVGPGTGQATHGFARRGWNVLGLEPGGSLAQEARRSLAGYPNVQFLECTFDDWEAGSARFDILYAAQSYHWVDPDVGLAKPKTVLVPRGHVALFWNIKGVLPTPLRVALDQAYAQHAPELVNGPVNGAKRVATEVISRFGRSQLYVLAGKENFRWTRRYTAQEYVRLLGTYSDHLALEPSRRESLFAAVGALIDADGGEIETPYETHCSVFQVM